MIHPRKYNKAIKQKTRRNKQIKSLRRKLEAVKHPLFIDSLFKDFTMTDDEFNDCYRGIKKHEQTLN